MIINKVCVFCGASAKCDRFYLDEAEKLGHLLAQIGKTIIYGGGNIGLMGRLADGALAEGGNVIGVIPNFLENLELGHNKIAELREVKTMHEREAAMMLDSDCIVALPGSTGTLSELLQAITWKRLGLIISPIIIVNLQGYFNPLIEMLLKTESEKFMATSRGKVWTVVANSEEAISLIDNVMFKPDDKSNFA